MNISDQGYNIVDMVTLNKTLGVEELDYWPDFRDKPMTLTVPLRFLKLFFDCCFSMSMVDSMKTFFCLKVIFDFSNYPKVQSPCFDFVNRLCKF